MGNRRLAASLQNIIWRGGGGEGKGASCFKFSFFPSIYRIFPVNSTRAHGGKLKTVWGDKGLVAGGGVKRDGQKEGGGVKGV